jgi:hypothetical protein
MVVERAVGKAVGAEVEVLAEDANAADEKTVAVDDVDAEDKLDVDGNAEMEAEEAGASCMYVKSNSSSLSGSGKTMSVL